MPGPLKEGDDTIHYDAAHLIIQDDSPGQTQNLICAMNMGDEPSATKLIQGAEDGLPE